MFAKKGGFTDKGFLDEINAIKEQANKKLEVGFFDEMHSTAEMSYADLAKFHARGGSFFNPVIPRDVLQVAFMLYKVNEDPASRKILSSFIENPKSVDVYDDLGKSYKEKIKNLFGSSRLRPTQVNPDPLIDTGELKDSTDYKIKGA